MRSALLALVALSSCAHVSLPSGYAASPAVANDLLYLASLEGHRHEDLSGDPPYLLAYSYAENPGPLDALCADFDSNGDKFISVFEYEVAMELLFRAQGL